MALPCQRRLFELPEGVTYLNTAYLGPLSRSVLEAGSRGWERKRRPWEIEVDDFFTTAEEARRLFARLIGGDAEGVSLTPSVSYGIAVAAANLPLQKGGEIALLAEQFPSNVYAWRDLAERSGGRLRTVARPADDDWTRAVLAAIGERTGIVALPPCHWTDGGLIDLERVGRRSRELGAALVIDGCQALGALPLDVSRVQPDFLVTASYKWLLGPYSQGFLWSAPHRRDGRPLEHNWISRQGSEDFSGLVKYTDRFAPGARRYDMGGMSNFALLPAAVAALRQTLEWGVEEIQATLRELTDLIAEEAAGLGLGVAPRRLRAGHLLGLRLGSHDPRAVAAALSEARVWVSVRGGSVRVSPHVFNDQRDVERLIAVLAKTLGSSAS